MLIGYLTQFAAHSMEEAEALCDRLGIFVNGELQCIGNAKEVPDLFVKHYLIQVCFCEVLHKCTRSRTHPALGGGPSY